MAQTTVTNFKTGDVVCLKSGGPLMTVVDTDGDRTQVAWFPNEREYNEVVIHKDALEKA